MWFVTTLRPTLPGTVHRDWLIAKVPVYRVEKLHSLLVCPDGVDDECEQSQASEEEHTVWQDNMGADFSPVCAAKIPHVVGKHHATVKHVDHHPLVGFPKQGVRPASLSEKTKIHKRPILCLGMPLMRNSDL